MTPDGSDNLANVSAAAMEFAHTLGNVQQMLSSSNRLLRPDTGPDVLMAIAESLRSAADMLQSLVDAPDERF